MRRWTLAVTLALAVAGSATAADDGFCARVLVGTESLSPLEARGVTYSVKDVEDLRFLVGLLGEVSGSHLLELRLLTPAGHHYQTLTAPIATELGEGGPERRVPGYPRPLPVQLLAPESFPEGPAMTARMSLPVAGTPIVSGSLYGAWTIELTLDGRPMDCEIRNFFVLTQ